MRFKNPFIVGAAGRLASATLWSLFRTVRLDLHTKSVDPYDTLERERCLFSVWHDSAVMAAFGGKHHRTVALTSRHRDGTFVANVLSGVKVKSVRGSSGRGGRRAALEILKLATDNDIVITPDGPRGPRRKMSRGIVYLASRTGHAIIPTAFTCSNTWDIQGSWTSLTIPKPFSNIVLLAGEPIRVPPDVADQEMDAYIETVQKAMDRIQELAVAQLASPTESPMPTTQSDKLHKAA